MTPTTLGALPGPLSWRNDPIEAAVEAADRLSITAGAETDWFVDPAGTAVKSDAPVAFFTPPDETFRLSARVTVTFASMYDAGVMLLHVRDDLWAKLCFEYSPQGEPMIVSVVTRGASDDCNSTVIEGHSVYLRVYRQGDVLAFHYSLDGQVWRLVRYFTLGSLDRPQLGLAAQSPTGPGCRVVFDQLRYQAQAIGDLRSGE